ncbi:hypothetical protein H9P43_009485 [Blastocladiella emersonii ATCC 22665]|nr:hypothetical protein H9P43_009485 [Blastocladiella emersonii ATCC 22665]
MSPTSPAMLAFHVAASALAGAALAAAGLVYHTTPPREVNGMDPAPEKVYARWARTKHPDHADGEECDAAAEGCECRTLLDVLYAVAEDEARADAVAHTGIRCDHCGKEIHGVRFKCTKCADYDLCADCESQGVHDATHVFLKLRIPLPPYQRPGCQLAAPLYPGNRPAGDSLASADAAKLQFITHFSLAELDALFDQFKSLATDARGISRTVYDQSLGPLGLERNLITERIFTFFDRDNDGFITFPEFAAGMSVLAKGAPEEKITFAFKGYDLDGDGRITRAELHAMFKAYFHLSMELVRDVVQAMEDEEDEEAELRDDPGASGPAPAGRGVPFRTMTGRIDHHHHVSPQQLAGRIDTGFHSALSSALPSPISEEPPAHPLFSDAPHVADPESASDNDEDGVRTPRQQQSRPLPQRSRPWSSRPTSPTRNSAAAVGPRPLASRLMSMDLSGENAAAAASYRVQPIMEQISQAAILELVDRVFHGIDGSDEKGYIEEPEFRAYVASDATLISWFEMLGSVF